MSRETLPQDIKQGHHRRGHELRLRQIRRERQTLAQAPQQGTGDSPRLRRPRPQDALSDAEEALDDRIEQGGVELEKVAVGIDHDVALQRALVAVVADHVVWEIVDDLEREEEAWVGDVGLPFEDALVDDVDLVGVRAVCGVRALRVCEPVADLDDPVFGPRVDVGVGGADVVEDVAHHGPVAGAELVDDQVVVGEEREFVVGDEVATDGFAVVRLEELGGGVPELAGVGGVNGVEGVLEGGVARAEEGLEGGFVGEGGEGEGRRRGEDDGRFGEVAIVGVVEGVWEGEGKRGGGGQKYIYIMSFPSLA